MASSHLIIPIVAVGLLVTISVYKLYRLSTGPLAHLPGPTISKYSGVVSVIQSIRGERVFYLKKLHDQYGPIVRVSPNEVSVGDLQSHKDVHKIGGGFLKTDFYAKFVGNRILTMFSTSDPVQHSRWRRLLGNSMSESVLKSFEGIVRSKIDLLMGQTAKEHQKNGHIDIYKWMHYFATDVIGELTFGESFRMLELGKPNQYIEDVQVGSKIGLIAYSVSGIRRCDWPNLPIWPISEMKRRTANVDRYAAESIDRYERYRALNPNEPKPMLFDKVMGDKGKAADLSREEINAQAGGYIVAGTDTTAVTGTYLIWSVCQNPAVKAKLLDAIKDLPEVPTNDDLRQITYLDHLIDETLRLYGAAPAPLPRSVPAGGRTLAGHYVPEGMTVSPVAFVLHRDQKIFPNPEMWVPERWENATKEMRDASYAFGGGSRICIGMHLAKMELRGAVTAFFRQFPTATVAYGEDGFSERDMGTVEFFLLKARGGRCLIK